MANDKKFPAHGETRPDSDRSPYEKSPLEHASGSYPKGEVMPGRGGYPSKGNPSSGGYPSKRK